MKLPAYHLTKRPAKDRKRLAAWLAEREISSQLCQEDGGASPPPALRYHLGRAGSDVVEPGHIFILRPPVAESHPAGPMYVLVLDVPSRHRFLAVPFSRYATPAVPGEWATGSSALPLRVLCLWNAREIARDVLLGRPAQRWPQGKVAEARMVHRHVFMGDSLPDKMAARLGPPLVHPADPRYEYLDEEVLRLDEHVRHHSGSGTEIADEDGQHRGATWLMAAEGRPGFGKKPES